MDVIRGQLLRLCDLGLISTILPQTAPRTNTRFNHILNKYWTWTEGDARLFVCVINILFFFHWQVLTVITVIPFVQLAFAKICLPHPSTTVSLMFCELIKFLQTGKVSVTLGNLICCCQILTAKSINFPKYLSSATDACEANTLSWFWQLLSKN